MRKSNLSQNFEELLEEITPNIEENESIKERCEYIGSSLSENIEFDKRKLFFLSGANSRLTQIKPITDMDIMIVLDFNTYFEKYKIDPRGLVNFIAIEVRKIYPIIKSRKQTHSLRLMMCKKIPKIDLIPAFLINENREIYCIPNTKFGNFSLTSPPTNKKTIESHDIYLNLMFIPLVRLLKKWRDEHRIFMTSFHLEVLAMNIVKEKFKYYQEGLSLFFKGASRMILDHCGDPAKLSGDLSYYLNYDNKVRLSNLFLSKYNQIEKLIKLEDTGEEKKAMEGWNDFLIGKKNLEKLYINQNQ